MTESIDLTPSLQFLVGEPLNGVCFFMDYVELHFNGSYVRCLAPPAVTRGTAASTFPNAGSRDALCGLIGLEVQAAAGVDDAELRLEFTDGSTVSVDLSHGRRVGPEAVHIRNQATGEIQYW
jgi:hypothetical protein